MYLGELVSIFFQNFFQNFFYEYFVFGIVPPFKVSKCHIWGAYGRGEGVIPNIGGMPLSEGGDIKLLTYVHK